MGYHDKCKTHETKYHEIQEDNMLSRQQTTESITRFRRPTARSHIAVHLALALFLLFTVTACNDSSAVYNEEPEVETVAIDIQDEIDDQEITWAVERELLFDAKTSSTDIADIEVTTTEGIVTLDGSTDNILTRDRAQRIAESIKGVRSVVNQVTVRPTDRSDMEIANDVLDALANDPATEAWEITTDVSDGIVTLNGSVDSWQEKQLAAKVAKGVRGVRGITNDIAVDVFAERPDAEIEEEIEQVLRWDVRIDDALINVEANQGMVTLTGTVGSAFERTLALNDAYVKGVTEVEASGLDIRWWARDDMKRTEWASNRTESQIQDAVADALLYDPRVSAFDVDVEVIAGTVTLNGIVDNLKAKQAAAQDARNTVGVWNVQNNLVVEPRAPQPDDSIASAIRARLTLDPYVERYEINVDVDDGVAMLEGQVDTYFEKWQAGDVAGRVPGVTVVNNDLEVDYQAPPFDLTIYDWDPITNDMTYIPQEKADAEIKDDIEQELWWSPFVDETEVTVTVENGMATLTGTVDTWTERTVATEEAYEGGALDVENALIVTYGPESGSEM